jgi:hypothetical protein
MSAPIVFMDTECDGLRPDRKVWEVAIVRREPDGREVEWQAFVEIDLSTAEPYGLQVGRFYERHPAGRYLAGLDASAERMCESSMPSTAAIEVARMTHGAHVVGAVPSFDTHVLDGLLRGHGLIPAWHYHLLDVEVLAVGYLRGRGVKIKPPYSSDEITELLGVAPAAEHERQVMSAS